MQKVGLAISLCTAALAVIVVLRDLTEIDFNWLTEVDTEVVLAVFVIAVASILFSYIPYLFFRRRFHFGVYASVALASASFAFISLAVTASVALVERFGGNKPWWDGDDTRVPPRMLSSCDALDSVLADRAPLLDNADGYGNLPRASARLGLERFVDRNEPLDLIALRLHYAIVEAGYRDFALYHLNCGLVFLLPAERISDDGTPAKDRWDKSVSIRMAGISWRDYLYSLVFPPQARFRMISLIVTGRFSQPENRQPSMDKFQELYARGLPSLHGIPHVSLDRGFTIYANVYEFYNDGTGASFVRDSNIDGYAHLEKSGLIPALKALSDAAFRLPH